jgi:SAM-dependent methyltransferase
MSDRAKDGGFSPEEAERWDLLYEAGKGGASFGLVRGCIRRRVQARREQCLALLGPGSGRVLDLACGAGRFSSGCAELGWHWIGLDLSPAMLGRARRGSAWGRIIRGDLRRLPFRRESAEALLVIGILSYFPDQAAQGILRQVAATLRPGGILLVQAIRFDPLAHLRSRLPEWVARPWRIPGPLYPRSPRVLAELLRAAGVRPERIVGLTKFGGLPAATLVRAVKVGSDA